MEDNSESFAAISHPPLVPMPTCSHLNQHKANAAFGGPNYLMLGTSTMSVLSLLLTAGYIEEVEDKNIETELLEEPTEEANVNSNDSDNVVIRVDRWIVLKLNKAEYELIKQGREILGLALVQYVHKPDVVHSGSIIKALDRVLSALTKEQGLTSKIAAASGTPVFAGRK